MLDDGLVELLLEEAVEVLVVPDEPEAAAVGLNVW